MAAHLLDYEHFAHVPTTALVNARAAAEQAAGQLLGAALLAHGAFGLPVHHDDGLNMNTCSG